MPEYLAPGVYTEEINTGPVPIEGVSTSTAGFVGLTERGPTTVRMVTSLREFERWYGGPVDPDTVSFLPFAAKGFFDNGGQRLFVARVTRPNAVPSSTTLATNGAALVLRAIGPGNLDSRLFVRVLTASPARCRQSGRSGSEPVPPSGDLLLHAPAPSAGRPVRSQHASRREPPGTRRLRGLGRPLGRPHVERVRADGPAGLAPHRGGRRWGGRPTESRRLDGVRRRRGRRRHDGRPVHRHRAAPDWAERATADRPDLPALCPRRGERHSPAECGRPGRDQEHLGRTVRGTEGPLRRTPGGR